MENKSKFEVLLFEFKEHLRNLKKNPENFVDITSDAVRDMLIQYESGNEEERNMIMEICNDFWLIRMDKNEKMYIPAKHLNKNFDKQSDFYFDGYFIQESFRITITQLINFILGRNLDYGCFWIKQNN